MKNLQQIYNFCLLDATYNAYYQAPGDFECKTRQQYKYYHGPLNSKGISRTGTYLFHQAHMQLFRFLGIKPDWTADTLRFFLDPDTYELAERNDYQYPGLLIYVRTSIKGKGVRVEFTHPFDRLEEVVFYPRSHRQYTEEGIRLEVVDYINSKLLYPPGRYRELQMLIRIKKKDFVHWYKEVYLPEMQWRNEREHEDMVYSFTAESEMDWGEAHNLLANFGVFHVLGCTTDAEKDDITDQFYDMCN